MPYFQITNPLNKKYRDKTNVILFAHSLIGTVRGKSANGLMIHSKLFNVVAIIDSYNVGKKTSEICQGVVSDIPIYKNISDALNYHKAKAVVFLITPSTEIETEIYYAIRHKLDLINTSFSFIANIPGILELASEFDVDIFDLRNVIRQQAYPNVDILKRKAKVIYVTGTDCGLGKRTAAYELTMTAIDQGINAVMYATGQTGLMLGEKGTVVDALLCEFSNGVVSQQICQLSDMGYELIFVEGQSDIFHPANSAVALAILHGSNPDGLIIVHDESRQKHKGFEENSDLYKMHPLKRYIRTFEMLSLPCGPVYKTIGIATIGNENIKKIRNIVGIEDIAIADVRQEGGAGLLISEVAKFTELHACV